MPRYPNNMHPGPNEPSPRGPDDRKRASAHYYHPDLYNPVDDNEVQRSPRSTGAAVETPLSQPRQHQQPMMPGEQGRPPVTNNGPLGRSAANGISRARPPSYPGPPFEELENNKTQATTQRQQQQQQQQRRRGYRRTDSGEDADQLAAPPPSNGRPESISLSNQALPITRDKPNTRPRNAPQQPEPASPAISEASISTGNTIPRLNSPSVMTSVLQPLDGKVNEYSAQMNEAQKQMAQLDLEMAALQERRREAENRYMVAKTKHDDYRRQYQGVERALRGEPNVFSPMSFEDDDSERPSSQQTAQPPPTPGAHSRTESWSSMKPKSGTRFRMSKIFG